MKLLCFQAEHFGWKTHSKTLPEVADRAVEEEIEDALVVFVHAEHREEDAVGTPSVMRRP